MLSLVSLGVVFLTFAALVFFLLRNISIELSGHKKAIIQNNRDIVSLKNIVELNLSHDEYDSDDEYENEDTDLDKIEEENEEPRFSKSVTKGGEEESSSEESKSEVKEEVKESDKESDEESGEESGEESEEESESKQEVPEVK